MAIISTEDMVARAEILNDQNQDWSSTSYWTNLCEEEYRACDTCDEDTGYVWDDDEPELCYCDDGRDGIDDYGRVLITRLGMKKLRRKRWDTLVGWDEDDVTRVFSGDEMLPEDIQDQSAPMVVIGTDVVNLYPSLDIGQVVEEVREAILDTGIKFEDVDYLEAARYVALNWSESQCIRSGLRRILPRRRYTTGSRPGLTGQGPQ